ncbi:unnamed protein product [Closterium sp. NIES-64]|nr:unnamed protein product [Closterium sp. NIES-64]
MDLAQLSGVLQQALSANPEERKAGEAHLVQVQSVRAGHLVALLQMVVRADVDLAIRQVAAIHFKNTVSRNWRTKSDATEAASSGSPLFSEGDVAAVRDNLVEAVICCPPLIRSQLIEVLKAVVQSDYPERMPALLQQALANLHSPDQPRVYGALVVVRVLARKYEFKDEEDRVPVHEVVTSTFPQLLVILPAAAGRAQPVPRYCEYIKLVLKIFWSRLLRECHISTREGVLLAWMECFYTLLNPPFPLIRFRSSLIPTTAVNPDPPITAQGARDGAAGGGVPGVDGVLPTRCLERPVPTEGQPVGPRAAQAVGVVEGEEGLLHIINRMFHRFGNPKYAKGDDKAFATMFADKCAGRLLNSYLPPAGAPLSKKALYESLKPHLQVLQFEVAFPLLCFNDHDALLWADNPLEYVRKDMCAHSGAQLPGGAGTKRSKDTLDPFIAALVLILNRYNEAAPEQKAAQARQKDGALLAIGALHEKLQGTARYKAQLEHMLLTHVFPEFTSPCAFLRAKVCFSTESPAQFLCAWRRGWRGSTADIPFSNPAHFGGALQAVVGLLRDPELPVRVDAVVALRSFVDACEDLDQLRPIIPNLLDDFFKLMHEVENEDLVFHPNTTLTALHPLSPPPTIADFFKLMHEVENEDLVFTLEVIVEKFGEEMSPLRRRPHPQPRTRRRSGSVCGRQRQQMAGESEEAVDDMSALAAAGCLRAMGTAAAFWKCVRSSEAAEGGESEEAVDDMSALAAAGCLRAMGTVLESISSLPHLFPQLEPTLLPILHKMLTSDGQDLYEEVLEIATYMTRTGPVGQLHLTWHRALPHVPRPNYPDSLWKLLSKLLSDDDISDRDVVPAPKLMEVVLPQLPGAGGRMVVANGLYYNAQLTLQTLEGMGATAGVFQTWLTMLQAKSQTTSKRLHFKSVSPQHDKKVCILGLVSLLSLPHGCAAGIRGTAAGRIRQAVLQLLVAYKEQQEAAAELESEDDDDDEEGEDGMGDGGEEDEDEEEEEEEGEESSELKKAIKKAHKMLDGDEEEDEDDEGFWSDEDEMLTPIDDVDPFIHFSDIMAIARLMLLLAPPAHLTIPPSLTFFPHPYLFLCPWLPSCPTFPTPLHSLNQPGVQASDPARFSSLMGSLDFAHQAMAHTVAQVAQQQRDSKAKEAAEKAAGGAAAT